MSKIGPVPKSWHAQCQNLDGRITVIDGLFDKKLKTHTANVFVMGRNLPTVDATCAQITGINPEKIP